MRQAKGEARESLWNAVERVPRSLFFYFFTSFRPYLLPPSFLLRLEQQKATLNNKKQP
jgi:hypothetical protein